MKPIGVSFSSIACSSRPTVPKSQMSLTASKEWGCLTAWGLGSLMYVRVGALGVGSLLQPYPGTQDHGDTHHCPLGLLPAL